MNEVFPKNMNMKQAVLSTLAYFDLFGVALTRNEISEYLFFAQPDEEKISIYLKESPLIKQESGYFFLSKDPDFFLQFKAKIVQARTLWKKIRTWQWIFDLCPFIELVCVCNSLPLYAVDEKSDIDLLIVTKKNRLFLARAGITVLTSLFGLRRHDEKIAGRFCLSFYITEERMSFENLSLTPYDVYLAYWIKTLEPISGNSEQYERLQTENHEWTSLYFKSSRPHRRYFRKSAGLLKRIKTNLEKILDKDWLEKWLAEKQLRRAKDKFYSLKNPSGTIIREDILKFHNDDRREAIRQSWKARLDEFL